MKNKKTLLTVLFLATVATFLTFFLKPKGTTFMMTGPLPLTDKYHQDESDLMYRGSDTDSMPSAGGLTNRYEEKTSLIDQAEPIEMGMMPSYYYPDDALDVEDRVYQKSSNHSVVVDDVSTYLRSMKEYILSIDGRVLNSGVSAGDKYDSGSLYVKVPVLKFDEATTRVTENVEKIVSENISASDVTGQLVNTTENLQALKDAKSLKEAAMKDAKTEVEKRRYQIEIDRLNRQITTAEKSVDRVETKVEYSSISILAADSERFFNPSADLSIREEFLRAWTSLKAFLKVGGYFGIWILVYSIVWIPVIWAFKKVAGFLKG